MIDEQTLAEIRKALSEPYNVPFSWEVVSSLIDEVDRLRAVSKAGEEWRAYAENLEKAGDAMADSKAHEWRPRFAWDNAKKGRPE